MNVRRALILALSCSIVACGRTEPESSQLESGEYPVVLWDGSHNNYGVDTTFNSYLDWLGGQGYAVSLSEDLFNHDVLAGVDVLVLDNPLAEANIEYWGLPTPSAYADDEVSAVIDWVRAGGAVLMVVEHMPFPGAFGLLLDAFEVEASNGFAIKSSGVSLLGTDDQGPVGLFVYKRSSGDFPDHPVVAGRTVDERIDTLAADWGSAFRMPDGATILLTLPDDALSVEPEVAWEFDSTTTMKDVGGWSQAGLMQFGEGRVAVIGDNFLLTDPGSLIEPADQIGIQHPQFTINLFRWLAGN